MRRLNAAMSQGRASARSALRQASGRAPWLYRLRMNTQRFPKGSIHDADFEVFRSTQISVALDVGANRGQSIVTIKSLAPSARIVAFEPNLQLLPALQRVAKRYDKVTIAPVGCARSTAMSTLYTPVARGIVFDQLASLEPLHHSATLDLVRHSGFAWCAESDLEIRQSTAVFAPLDLMVGPDFPTVDLLKIDVEGAELDVVAGGMELIRRDHPLIIAERPDAALISLLAGLGYEHHASRHGQNSVFVSPEKHKIDHRMLDGRFRRSGL